MWTSPEALPAYDSGPFGFTIIVILYLVTRPYSFGAIVVSYLGLPQGVGNVIGLLIYVGLDVAVARTFTSKKDHV